MGDTSLRNPTSIFFLNSRRRCDKPGSSFSPPPPHPTPLPQSILPKSAVLALAVFFKLFSNFTISESISVRNGRGGYLSPLITPHQFCFQRFVHLLCTHARFGGEGLQDVRFCVLFTPQHAC